MRKLWSRFVDYWKAKARENGKYFNWCRKLLDNSMEVGFICTLSFNTDIPMQLVWFPTQPKQFPNFMTFVLVHYGVKNIVEARGSGNKVFFLPFQGNSFFTLEQIMTHKKYLIDTRCARQGAVDVWLKRSDCVIHSFPVLWSDMWWNSLCNQTGHRYSIKRINFVIVTLNEQISI